MSHRECIMYIQNGWHHWWDMASNIGWDCLSHDGLWAQMTNGNFHHFSEATAIDLLHKSHNAPVPYPIRHHFVTEMCTFVSKWCIVGYLANALWDLWDGSICLPAIRAVQGDCELIYAVSACSVVCTCAPCPAPCSTTCPLNLLFHQSSSTCHSKHHPVVECYVPGSILGAPTPI